MDDELPPFDPGITSVTAPTAAEPSSFACSTRSLATRFTRATGDCFRALPPPDRGEERVVAAPRDAPLLDAEPRDDPPRADDVLRADDDAPDPLLDERPLREDADDVEDGRRDADLPAADLFADDFLAADLLAADLPAADFEAVLLADVLRAAVDPPRLAAVDVLRAADPPRAAPVPLRDGDLLALAPREELPDRAPAVLLLEPLRVEPDRLAADPPRPAPPDRVLPLPPVLPDRPLLRAVLPPRDDFDAVAMSVLLSGGCVRCRARFAHTARRAIVKWRQAPVN